MDSTTYLNTPTVAKTLIELQTLPSQNKGELTKIWYQTHVDGSLNPHRCDLCYKNSPKYMVEIPGSKCFSCINCINYLPQNKKLSLLEDKACIICLSHCLKFIDRCQLCGAKNRDHEIKHLIRCDIETLGICEICNDYLLLEKKKYDFSTVFIK